jgi:trehalose utilization protein
MAVRRRTFLRAGARTLVGGALTVAGADSWAAEKAAPPVTTPRTRNILVWSEGTAPENVYPKDIRGAVAEALAGLPGNYVIRTATLTDPDQGAGQAALDGTDVLFWWGHKRHGDVTDATVDRIVKRVVDGGMGVVFLHSAHFSKPLKAVLQATGAWKEYTNDGKPQDIHVVTPAHPIARGVRDFVIPREERYEEPFEVPTPDTVVFDALYESTQTRARQGLCWTRGKGRVFYFRPGHEEFPVFFQPEIKRIVRNAALWAARDEAGILEDADPAARAARGAGEPPLAILCGRLGYAGTDITAPGETKAQRFVKAGTGPVKTYPLAAYGVPKECAAGWYATDKSEKRTLLWKVDARHNKEDNPPTRDKARITFDPGDRPFGLWIASQGFPTETICSEDAQNAAIARFGGKPIQKARVYAAVSSAGTPLPNTYIIGWEYSTNDDFQDMVTVVENVRPA